MAHNNNFNKLKMVYFTLIIIQRKVIMDFYRKVEFQHMELAFQQNFETTMNLSKELIENTQGYDFVEFNSFKEMYNIHKSQILTLAKKPLKF